MAASFACHYTQIITKWPHNPRYKLTSLEGHAAALLGSRVYVYGGHAESWQSWDVNLSRRDIDDMHVLCLATNRWTRLLLPQASRPPALAYHNLILVEDVFYIYGKGEEEVLYCFDPVLEEYAEVEQSILAEPSAHTLRTNLTSACLCAEYLPERHALVAYKALTTQVVQTLVEWFDLETRKWSLVATKGEKPEYRRNPCSCLRNSRMYVYTAESRAGANGLTSFLYLLDFLPTTPMWSKIASVLFPSSFRASMVWINNQLIVFGGSGSTYFCPTKHRVLGFDMNTRSGEVTAMFSHESEQFSRRGQTAIALPWDSEIIILGGGGGTHTHGGRTFCGRIKVGKLDANR